MKRIQKTENPNAHVFETHVEEYDSWYDRYPFVFQSEVEAIRSMLPPGNSYGIEVGLGTGRFAKALGIKEGVEPSAPMREMAIERGIEAMDATAEVLPYKDEHFDFVLMASCISYFHDLRPAFKEANRVLKSGGSLIVGFIEKNSPIGKYYESIRQESTFYKTALFYSTEKVLDELRKAGFAAFETSQTLFDYLDDTNYFEPAQPGHDKGSFIVIKAIKK
jgi:ubiquinone/menaquinone biosynthesis C-methylase UbiE